MFVAMEPVAVGDEAGNTIYIRPKMGKGVEAQVSAEFNRLGGRSQVAYEFCLLAHNILGWDGPAFVDERGVPVPVNRANIDRLDPHEPLVALTMKRIAELNTRPSLVVPGSNGHEPDPTEAAAPT